MGLRGVGATRLREAREAAKDTLRVLPWTKKGLSRAQRVLAFLEFLPITKGILAGKRMKLLPEQTAFIKSVYGRGSAASIAIKSEPRGNGKTGLVAGLALCHLLGPESEPRGEVYSAAIDRQQAGLLFAEMEAIIYAVPEFACRVNVVRGHKKMDVLSGDGDASVYEALSADARRAHGLAPSFWVYDELAQARTRELLDNLVTAMGKRKQSLGMVISTQAPTDDHPLSQLIDDGLTGQDASIVVHLKTAPEDADPFDPATIRACNPAIGVFLKEDDLLKEAERARRLPAFEPAFRNLRLNQRVDAREEERIVSAAVWKACAETVDADALRGRVCYGGLDLSGKHDLCTLQLVFPDDATPSNFEVLSFFWTPEGQIEARRPAEQERFREWIRAGHIEAVPGATVRFGFVAMRLAELSAMYEIANIHYDRWRIDDMMQELADIGADLPMAPFGQGFKDMAPAVEFFAECALTGRIRHGAHPVLTAAVANAILISDPSGNQKFDKERGNKRGPVRIDGAVALAMALAAANATPEPQYIEGEMVVL